MKTSLAPLGHTFVKLTKHRLLYPILGAGVICSAIAITLLADILSPRMISVLLIDVSQSAQGKQIQKLAPEICGYHLEQSFEGDVLISGRFEAIAEFQGAILNAQNETTLRQECQQAGSSIERSKGQAGTDLIAALQKAFNEVQLERDRGFDYPVQINVVIDTAEPSPGQFLFASTALRELLEPVLRRGDTQINFIGTDYVLQNQLRPALSGLPNHAICTWLNYRQCLTRNTQIFQKPHPISQEQ